MSQPIASVQRATEMRKHIVRVSFRCPVCRKTQFSWLGKAAPLAWQP